MKATFDVRDAESELEAFAAYKAGDREAYDALLIHITKTATNICKNTLKAAWRTEHADALQTTILHAIIALPDFDPDRGFRLSSFLAPRMRGACPNPQNEHGEYWWYHPLDEFALSPEPQIVFVRWFRGAVKAFYLAGAVRKVHEMRGEWSGPILPPEMGGD